MTNVDLGGYLVHVLTGVTRLVSNHRDFGGYKLNSTISGPFYTFCHFDKCQLLLIPFLSGPNLKQSQVKALMILLRSFSVRQMMMIDVLRRSMVTQRH